MNHTTNEIAPQKCGAFLLVMSIFVAHMAIVYTHHRKDNGQIFYVGIGKKENRAFTKNGRQRNPHWHRVVDKHGFTVSITHTDILWEEACVIEKYLIAFYRELLGKSAITNIVDGGEGVTGMIMSDSSKQKMRERKLGTIWDEERKIKHAETIKNAYKNPIALENKRKGRIGVKCSDKMKQKVSELKKGGKNHAAKRCIDINTNIIYSCITDAANALGIKTQNLQRMLSGYLKNRTYVRFIGVDGEHIPCKQYPPIMKKQKVVRTGARTITEDHKKAIREANIGKKVSEATKMKISLSNSGKIRTREARKKISVANKGRKQTPEAIANKIAAAKKLVLNTATGIYYHGLQEAAESLPMNLNTLRAKMSGHSPNTTPFIYA